MNLTNQFDAGRLARLDGKSRDDCPFYATSNSADAWQAGYSFEIARPSDFMLGKVTHGRGYLVNVYASPRMKGRFPKLVYHVQWDDGHATVTEQERRAA